jgi:hypothetical protein
VVRYTQKQTIWNTARSSLKTFSVASRKFQRNKSRMTSYLTLRKRSCGFYGYPQTERCLQLVVWVYKDYKFIVTACGCTAVLLWGVFSKQCDQSVISVSQEDFLKSLLFRQDTTNTQQHKSAIKPQCETKATLIILWAFTLCTGFIQKCVKIQGVS